MGRRLAGQPRTGGSGRLGKVTNRKQEAAAKKKIAEEAKITKDIAKTKAKEAEKKETTKQLDDMRAQVEELKKAPPPPQPAQSSYYSQPAQPSYSQPAPQPQTYYPPPKKKIGFWERAHDTYKVVHKYRRMNDMIKAADKAESSQKSTRRVLNSAFNYYAEAERYQTKYYNPQ